LSNRKENILEIAIELFNEKGCMNTSTRHIADNLGISVGNLYYYFKNKEDIIIALYEDFMVSLSKQLTSVTDGIDEPFDFYGFLDEQMELERKYRFIRLEMGNLYSTYPKVKAALEIGFEKKQVEIKRLFLHQIKYDYLIKLDRSELEYLCSNVWIIGSQWEIFWIVHKVGNEKLRRFQGELNFLYFIKPYVTKKGLEKSNLLKSIEYVKKEIENVK